ncbi:MAG: SRPBCC family protein [Acidobacteriota bacterium]
MSEHILKRVQTLDRPVEEVFEFFADAGNLESITPPALKFRIITDLPIQIKKGALIDYSLRMRGFPINWRTEISMWDPPNEFVDQQIRGPYRQWIHRHTFTPLGLDKTLMEDEVRYRLPIEPFGDIVHFIVRRELDQIFDFRRDVVAGIFGG